jgi:YD repeat-containing protein
VTFSPDGKLVSQVMRNPDGTTTTLSQFDAQGNATAGSNSKLGSFTITHDPASGDETWTYANDGSQVTFSPDGKLVSEVVRNPDGTTTTLNKFDDQGRPTAGVDQNGQPFTITYDANGDIFTHFADGTTIEDDPHGHPIKTWLPNGTEIDWAVDLPALYTAIGQVSAERNSIADNFGVLKVVFGNIEEYWQSPAGKSYTPLAETFNTATQAALDVLDEAISRMKQAYNNYAATEGTNVNNLGG